MMHLCFELFQRESGEQNWLKLEVDTAAATEQRWSACSANWQKIDDYSGMFNEERNIVATDYCNAYNGSVHRSDDSITVKYSR